MAPLVSVRDVSKTFRSKRGDVSVLERVTFDVPEQRFVSIVGPSGCGKTTLLRIVAGLTGHSTGSVVVDSRELSGPAPGTGFVFQSPVLLEWRTVLDNVLLPIEILRRSKRDSVPRATQLLEMAGLEDFAHRYPNELSGGMQQRVAICRALIIDPKILLMDEPFGALDALTREEMGRALLDIWQGTGKTILFVTHSIDEAVFLSDRVLVMGPRPTGIRLDLDVPLPRPRSDATRLDERFLECCEQVRREIFTEQRARGGQRRTT